MDLTKIKKNTIFNRIPFKNFRRTFSVQINTGIALIILGIIISFLSPHFLTAENLLTILHQVAIISVVAVGMMIIILTGGIDLSIGSIVALSAGIMGELIVNHGLNQGLGILLALAIGTFAGFINGIIITKIKIPAFIVTLGMMSVWRGIALQLTGATHTTGMPNIIIFLGQGHLGPIPFPFIITIIVYLIFWYMLRYTRLGVYTYAIGGNETSSIFAGINVDRIKLYIYVISGFLCGLTALMLAGRLNGTSGTLAGDYALDSVAAVIIGGTSIFGGEGVIWGTIIGALIMGVIRNGLVLLNVSAFYQMISIGIVVVGSVSVDALRRRRSKNS